jgi:CRP-like cAMP-binding protein
VQTDPTLSPPPPPCAQCPLRKRPAFVQKTPKEVEWLQKLKNSAHRVTAGSDLFRVSDPSPELYTLYSGWAFRYRALPDGRRQILNFFLPGDLIGFQASLIEPADHNVEALTDLQLCVFKRKKVWNIFQDYPELAFQLTWLGAREEGMVDDGLTAVGQLSAMERMSTMIVGLFKRARGLGLVEDDSFEFPLRREHLADALGLSLVHTIKTWTALRRAGLFEPQGSRLKLVNPRLTPTLAAFFEQERRPRPIM